MATRQDIPFKQVGEYEVLAPIAEGGMASVWLARSTSQPHGLVALKVIRSQHARNKDFVAMLRDEAQIASRLSHPNIIATYGLGHDGTRHFLAMEVLRGRSLLDVWQNLHAQGLRVPYDVLAWIGARIADALQYAHERLDDRGAAQHVVHRDVNPANIFLTSEGVPKLIDFGLARAKDRLTSTAAGIVKGTLAYLAPEQAHGHTADARADVFALGVTLWEVSLDRRLFREDSDVETVRRVREADVPDPVSLVDTYPPALGAAVRRALARNPQERWQTAGDLRDALDAFVRSGANTVDAASVRSLLGQLSTSDGQAPWERLVEEASLGPERIRVWDDDRQKLTWMHASVEESTTLAGDERATLAPDTATVPRRESLDRALAHRIATLGPDPVAVARAHLERSLVDEVLGDGTVAATYAKASLATSATATAHGVLRRLEHGPRKTAALVLHLDAEIAECAHEPASASLLAERARLLQASNAPLAAVRAAWERVLSVSPREPAALRGLEAALEAAASGEPAAGNALAAHLGRMAEAYSAEPRLAAWLLVEQARVLDNALGQPDAAKASLARALELDGAIGPVRAACVAHAVVHRDAACFVSLLIGEALLEPDPARKACLELDAGCVARHRLNDTERAISLLESCIARTPIARPVQQRAVEDLTSWYEGAGRPKDALRTRSMRLAMLDDPRARAHEQRAIAALHESLGARRAAIAALESALDLAPDDATLAEELDRLLELESLTGRRIDLLVRQSAAAADVQERARRLVRAARLAESVGEIARAVELLRAALVARPADEEAMDGLRRLFVSAPTEPMTAEARARIDLHVHAAEHSRDPARRIAHLEAAALLEAEMAGDPARAQGLYEAVLRLEPGRRGAIIGLARMAARAGDMHASSRALLEEAAATPDAGEAAALCVRAAVALAVIDEERALAIVGDVLGRAPGHAEALELEQRLHERAGRWARVDAVLARRIEHAVDPKLRVELWMARSDVQRTRLHAPTEVLASLRAALAIDPGHPAARQAMAMQLESLGDPRALSDGLAELAASKPSRDGATYLLRAGEVAELVLLDDARAAELYARAATALGGSTGPSGAGRPVGEGTGESWIADRRDRVLLRRARDGKAPELLASLQASLDLARTSAARSFDLAVALLDHGGDLQRATTLVDGVLSQDPMAPHALRTLERIARVTGATPLLANALAQQADAFAGDAAKLGALWAEVALVEWKLGGNAARTVERILRHAPADRAALDAAIRYALPSFRSGDRSARELLVVALRQRVTQAASDTERLYLHLAIALVLEPDPCEGPGQDAVQALAHYREALRVDPLSVVATAGVARLGARLGDAEAVLAGALSHADLASEAKPRAALLVQAAGHLLTAADPRLGGRPDRLSRAASLLERAIDADPEALMAMTLLVGVRTEDGQRERLLSTLRAAFDRAAQHDAIIQLGGEVARIASLAPPDHVVAVEALRRVLAVAPGHGPTLQALADHVAAQGAWGDAVEALETLVAQSRDPQAKVAALLQLSDLFAKTLRRSADAERALRAALDVDPMNLQALRALLAQRRGAGVEDAEVAQLLARLGEVEPEHAARAWAFGELAELRKRAGDVGGSERALVEATVLAPTPEGIAQVMGHFRGAPADQARILRAIVARAEELDRPSAACLALLGQLEVDAGRWTEGVTHLRVALGLAPGLHEARAALASGLARSGASAEALGVLFPMIVPDAAPLLALADPTGAVATLELALHAEGKREEALVARELRAIAGGLDDGAHVELRTRRPSVDADSTTKPMLALHTLRASVISPETSALFLDMAAAIVGAEQKLAPADRDELGIAPRDHVLPSGHPLVAKVDRLASMLAIPRPEVATSLLVGHPRVAMVNGPWLVVPASLLEQPEPIVVAALTRPLVRIALCLPWLDDLSGVMLHATLCGIARQVDDRFAEDLADDRRELVAQLARRVGKAIGRRNKKALSELAPALSSLRTPTLGEVAAFERGIARSELRVAFLTTGDLLATLDCARAADADLARATAEVGPRALAATLGHPLVGDLVAFALSPGATELRRRVGTVWYRG